MIPVQQRSGLSIADLPARASNVDDTRKILGGKRTIWNCTNRYHGSFCRRVEIWWGHRASDARWACDRWSSCCSRNGGCTARRI